MSPFVLLAAGVLWAASLAATGWWMYGAGEDRQIARYARENDIEERATAAAASAAASAIAAMQVKQVTIRQEMQREVRERVVFRDCHSGEPAVRLLNDTIGAAPAASAASAGELPASGSAR